MARRDWARSALALAGAALVATACVGNLGDGDSAEGGDDSPGVEAQRATTAIPRLSRREVDATLEDVFGITGAAERFLPADPDVATNPDSRAEEEVFDTLSATKTPSQVFVDGLESLAFAVARDVSAEPASVDALAGCTPASATDEACLRQLVENVGTRLWRRPLTTEEIDGLVAVALPFASDPAAGGDGFYVAARAALASLIASPELVYRTEIGTPVAEGVVALTDHELVARLSYFVWGTAPTPELLAAASDGLDEAALSSLVDSMLKDPRAEAQMRVFHELWLRYSRLLVTDEQLATDMRGETAALVDRSLEPASWSQLFTAEETFVTPALASHYGLSSPGEEAAWVPYEGKRAGLLSHGSFLSLSQTRMTQTLPSRRGTMVARRLLCQTILPPPPDVAADMGVEVPEDSCKVEAYEAHASGGCKSCHVIIDGIGFGFERYDGVGRYREVEAENPSCAIDGVGTVGDTTFRGPVEFSEQNFDTIAACAVDQLVRFAVRDWSVSEARLLRLQEAFIASGHDFRSLVRAVALDPAFRLRTQEAP